MLTLLSGIWFGLVMVQIGLMEKKSIKRVGHIIPQISSLLGFSGFWLILVMFSIITSNQQVLTIFLCLGVISHLCFMCRINLVLHKSKNKKSVKEGVALRKPNTNYEALVNVKLFIDHTRIDMEKIKCVVLREDIWVSPYVYTINLELAKKEGEMVYYIDKETYDVLNTSLSRLKDVRRRDCCHSTLYYFSTTTIHDLLNLEYYELDKFIESFSNPL